jgi:hypothetical protein
MITLKCRNCDCSLERKPGVGLVDERSNDICRWSGGKHVAVRLMTVTVSAKIAVDADAWYLAYGTPPDEIATDVRDYAREQMQAMVTPERMVRDVWVKHV